MSAFFDKEELENLQSLRHDLVEPIRVFTKEVYDDTVGDAGQFYASQARKAQRSMKLAQEKTKQQMAAIRLEQEKIRKRRNAGMKRAMITIALLVLLGMIIISAALSAHAEEQKHLSLGSVCLSQIPPDFENEAIHIKRAGINGNP